MTLGWSILGVYILPFFERVSRLEEVATFQRSVEEERQAHKDSPSGRTG